MTNLTKEQQSGLIGIALRAEMDGYSDGVLEMITLMLHSKPIPTAVEYFKFWFHYRKWSRTLCEKLLEYLKRPVYQDVYRLKVGA